MGQVHRRTIVKFRIFLDSRLFVDRLQGSHPAQTLIKVDMGFSICQTNNDLVDGGAPAKAID